MDISAFTPPGPGPWELDTAHFPRPFPKFALDRVMDGFVRGFSEGSANYGLLLSHLQPAIVNGFWYQQPVAFGAPPGAKGPPPAPILYLLTRLHPAMRARIRTSEAAFAQKRWRKDLEQWDAVDKPAALRAHEALLAVDPETLDDGALAAHVRACEAHVGAMIYLHHKYTVPCVIVVGDLLVRVMAWTGKSSGEVLGALRGSSKVSLGFSAAELETLARLLREDAEARAAFDAAPATEQLAVLCTREDAVGEAARTFFERVRHRALSYDAGERACGEMPSMLAGAIRAAAEQRFTAARDDAEARIASLRALVPEAERGTFDELLGEARLVNRLRDERGMYADCWAIGIARRALLEVGRRLEARGALVAFDHAVDLTEPEVRSLLVEGRGPTKDEVAQRVHHRLTATVADCPPFLNGEPAGPPDPAVLPKAARRGALAVSAVLDNLFKESERKSTRTVVEGISVNGGIYEGIARRVDGASQFDRIEQGDVLVTRTTAPYFNVVLPMLGAIVTDRGGQLCHAAIVAREYGIPGIVGTREATTLIPDGARVRVDGAAGTITVLSP